MSNKNGYLITLEGTEGAGKSTLARFIQDYLLSHHIQVILTREPGGTEIAEEIRALLLHHHDEILLPKTEALLMFASRVQHFEHKILPALKSGIWVLSDRFVDSSYAYQGAGRSLGFDSVHQLKEWCMGDAEPKLTFLLDVPLEIAAARIKGRGQLDRIEKENTVFFEKIKAMYLELAQRFPERFCVIDSSLEEKAVQAVVKRKLDELLNDVLV